MSKEERQQSLRRLHLYIAAYQPTPEDVLALHRAQQDLRHQIELKFGQSQANQHYIFPRAQSNRQSLGEQEWCAEAQGGREEGTRGIGARPKIKLVKAKQDKRVKTEYYDENRNNLLNAELSCCRPPPKIRLENNQNDNKLQHRLDRPLRDALNLTYNTTFRHEAREAASFSTGKSKLNQLTRSYANLKTKIGAGKLVKQMEETESELPRNGSSRCQPFHKGYEAVLNARSCLPASKIKPSCFKSETANFNRR